MDDKYKHWTWWQRLLNAVLFGCGTLVLMYGIFTAGLTLTIEGKVVELYGIYAFYGGFGMVLLGSLLHFYWICPSDLPISKVFSDMGRSLVGLPRAVVRGLCQARTWEILLAYLVDAILAMGLMISTVVLIASFVAFSWLEGITPEGFEALKMVMLYSAVSMFTSGILLMLVQVYMEKRQIR